MTTPTRAAAHPLEQAAEQQGNVAVGQGNHGNADDEEQARSGHEGLAAHPVGQEAGSQRGDGAARQDGGDHEGELAGIKAGGRLQVGEGAGDDADVYPVEKAAQAGDQQEKAIVPGLRAGSSRRGRDFGLGAWGRGKGAFA